MLTVTPETGIDEDDLEKRFLRLPGPGGLLECLVATRPLAYLPIAHCSGRWSWWLGGCSRRSAGAGSDTTPDIALQQA